MGRHRGQRDVPDRRPVIGMRPEVLSARVSSGSKQEEMNETDADRVLPPGADPGRLGQVERHGPRLVCRVQDHEDRAVLGWPRPVLGRPARVRRVVRLHSKRLSVIETVDITIGETHVRSPAEGRDALAIHRVLIDRDDLRVREDAERRLVDLRQVRPN
jgi:hypothetical protein